MPNNRCYRLSLWCIHVHATLLWRAPFDEAQSMPSLSDFLASRHPRTLYLTLVASPLSNKDTPLSVLPSLVNLLPYLLRLYSLYIGGHGVLVLQHPLLVSEHSNHRFTASSLLY